MTTIDELLNTKENKMACIININMMRQKIGLKPSDINFLLKRTHNELFELQNTTIQHYNEALKNTIG